MKPKLPDQPIPGAVTTRCSGEFFNPSSCDGVARPSTRVCAYCHSFQVDRARILLCRLADSPFRARKRLIRIEHASVALDLRFFALDDDNNYDGLLVFKTSNQAHIALSTWPDNLACLPGANDESVEFVKCQWCRRKVYPAFLPSCTRPSCLKKANLAGSKKRPSQSDQSTPEQTDHEKRRRQWRICPDTMVLTPGVDRTTLTRAVIQAPEELCAETTSVKFGDKVLRSDLDFVCGLKEVVIFSIPWPSVEELNDDGLRTEVTIQDERGVSGTLQFSFTKAELSSDLNEQIERLHLFEEDEGETPHGDQYYTVLSPLFHCSTPELRLPSLVDDDLPAPAS